MALTEYLPYAIKKEYRSSYFRLIRSKDPEGQGLLTPGAEQEKHHQGGEQRGRWETCVGWKGAAASE